MKKKKMLMISGVFLVLFIVFTLLVKFVDVGAIGPNGSEVGFQSLNKVAHEALGYNDKWYKLTKILEIIPFLICGYYGLQGVIQLIKYKDIKKVDKRLIYLGLFYILMMACYVFFEIVIVNFRPILLEGELEASYPSSHTILAMCICLSSLAINKYYIKNKNVLGWANIGIILLMVLLVGGRLLSGVHWLTDIIGGIILSCFLVTLYYASIIDNK